jgi:SprT protein
MKIIGNSDLTLQEKIQSFHNSAMINLQKNNISYLDEKVQVVLNPRMRSTAGRAYLFLQKIELNYRLLKDNEKELERTYLHELAHLVAHYIYGNKERGHGPLWGGIMNALGLPPDRCHSLDTKHLSRKMTRYLYGCKKDCAKNTIGFKLSPQRHRKIANFRVIYSCPSCRSPISFTGEMIKV